MSNAAEQLFDGRRNFSQDDEIERMLEEHFARHRVTHRDVWRNFPLYTRRVFLKRFLAHYELFRQVQHLPGDIVELGVYRGTSLLSWANFVEIRNMGDRHRKVIGFDNFAGFRKLDDQDGAAVPELGKAAGGFDGGAFAEQLDDLIGIFDADRFIPYKPRVEVVAGDVEQTVPAYVAKNPGMRIALLHFDVDLYAPTRIGLETLWPLVVPGGIVAFDEYGIPPWEGESRAVDEFFAGREIELRRFDWCSNPGAYLVKR